LEIYSLRSGVDGTVFCEPGEIEVLIVGLMMFPAGEDDALPFEGV
jgi:hypothetical protein